MEGSARSFAPGQPGALRIARQHGENLVAVRYRDDAENQRRLTTIELVVDQSPWIERSDHPLFLRIRFEESDLRRCDTAMEV